MSHADIKTPAELIAPLENYCDFMRRFSIATGIYCDAAWDEIYCWPPTRAGENVSRSCSEVMKDDPEIPNPEDIGGTEIFFYTAIAV